MGNMKIGELGVKFLCSRVYWEMEDRKSHLTQNKVKDSTCKNNISGKKRLLTSRNKMHLIEKSHYFFCMERSSELSQNGIEKKLWRF